MHTYKVFYTFYTGKYKKSYLCYGFYFHPYQLGPKNQFSQDHQYFHNHLLHNTLYMLYLFHGKIVNNLQSLGLTSVTEFSTLTFHFDHMAQRIYQLGTYYTHSAVFYENHEDV